MWVCIYIYIYVHIISTYFICLQYRLHNHLTNHGIWIQWANHYTNVANWIVVDTFQRFQHRGKILCISAGTRSGTLKLAILGWFTTSLTKVYATWKTMKIHCSFVGSTSHTQWNGLGSFFHHFTARVLCFNDVEVSSQKPVLALTNQNISKHTDLSCKIMGTFFFACLRCVWQN